MTLFYKFLWPALVFLVSYSLQAGELKLAGIFSDHAVLQSNMPVPVWGTADSGAEIKVEFGSQSKTTKSDINGKWKVKLDSMPMSKESRSLVITDLLSKNSVVFKDVLVGEVWIASGQSNMEMTTNGCLNADSEMSSANFPQIRQFLVPHAGSITPKEGVDGN